MKKIAFFNIGCRTNISEIQRWINTLSNDFIIDFGNPDIVVLNTCMVTKNAERKSNYKIKTLLKNYPNSKIIVSGCLIDGNGIKDDFKSNKNIILIKNKDKFTKFYEILGIQNVAYRKKDSIEDFKTRYNILIQTGCNSKCSYCIIPNLRGKETSRNINEILEEVTFVLENGVKEIILTGTNIARYNYNGYNLVKLVDKILNIPLEFRLRISSIEPWDFNIELAKLTIEDKRLCPFFHIPIQSGSEKILRLMRRPFNLDFYKRLIYEIKSINEKIMLGTDIIVGFPSETKKDFEEIYRFFESQPIEHYHVFTYSHRKGSLIFNEMNDNISTEEKKRRLKILQELGKRKKINFIESIKHYEFSFIPEEKHGVYYTGKTENFIDIKVKSNFLRRDNIYYIKIKDKLEYPFYEATII